MWVFASRSEAIYVGPTVDSGEIVLGTLGVRKMQNVISHT